MTEIELGPLSQDQYVFMVEAFKSDVRMFYDLGCQWLQQDVHRSEEYFDKLSAWYMDQYEIDLHIDQLPGLEEMYTFFNLVDELHELEEIRKTCGLRFKPNRFENPSV
jgi:hypothetical protein